MENLLFRILEFRIHILQLDLCSISNRYGHCMRLVRIFESTHYFDHGRKSVHNVIFEPTHRTREISASQCSDYRDDKINENII